MHDETVDEEDAVAEGQIIGLDSSCKRLRSSGTSLDSKANHEDTENAEAVWESWI